MGNFSFAALLREKNVTENASLLSKAELHLSVIAVDWQTSIKPACRRFDLKINLDNRRRDGTLRGTLDFMTKLADCQINVSGSINEKREIKNGFVIFFVVMVLSLSFGSLGSSMFQKTVVSIYILSFFRSVIEKKFNLLSPVIERTTTERVVKMA